MTRRAKKKNKSKNHAEKGSQGPSRAKRGWALAGLLVAAALIYMYGKRGGTVVDNQTDAVPPPPSSAPSATAKQVPPFYEDSSAAKPFPKTLPPSLFRDPVAARAYEIAGHIPEVLVQQPCYCWCEGHGHESLLDCYTDGHASGCTACVQETFLAKKMTDSGQTPAEIRQSIIRGDWRSVDIWSAAR